MIQWANETNMLSADVAGVLRLMAWQGADEWVWAVYPAAPGNPALARGVAPHEARAKGSAARAARHLIDAAAEALR